jgi:aspartate racemase
VIIDKMRSEGCDCVALVCTELPILVTAELSSLPTLDSTRMLARAALEVAIGDRTMPTWKGGPVRADRQHAGPLLRRPRGREGPVPLRSLGR